MKNKPSVAVVMGSVSDKPIAEKAVSVLAELGVDAEVRVLSTHRTPKETAEYAEKASGRGIRVFIAVAGMSAALGGVIAAHTLLPVIGVPVASGALQGVDALLATSQMPPGVPVACMAIGQAGATNAAVLAAQILALSDEDIRKNLEQYRALMKEEILKASAEAGEQE